MDGIRQRTAEAQAEENLLLRQRAEAKKAGGKRTLQAILTGNILSLFLLTAIFVFLRKENIQRVLAEMNLRRQRDLLEERVAERTAVVTRSNEQLAREIAVRKQAEEEACQLHEIVVQEKDRLSALVNSIADEIWFADAKGKSTLVNPSGSRQFDLQSAGAIDARELAGSLEVLQLDGTPRPIDEAPPFRALRGEVVPNQEELVRTPATGELRHRQVSSAPVRDAKGTIIGAVSVVRDVTDLKKAETALQESETRFRTMVNAMPQLAWSARADGHIFWYNQRWYDYTGAFPEQMEGWGWRSVRDRSELPKVLEHWQSCIATGELFEMTFPLRGADGVFRLFLTRVVPLKDAAGHVQQWFGTNTDVNELKCVEQALRESEALYRGIGESIGYGVWVCAPDGPNTYASESFLQMVGMTQEHCSNVGWGDVLHPDDAERTLTAWQECVRTGGRWDIEHRFRGTDGEWHHVLARGVPVRNEQGEIISWTGINLDISLLKQAEERIKAQLAEKDVMLKEIHHRVKHSLQIISSLVSLQADSLDDERMREVFGDVRDRVRAMALVHEKLYQTGDLAQLDFADYAANLLQYLWRSHGTLAEKVRLNLEVAPVVRPIDSAVPCGLILNELVSNTLKHAFPNGGGGEVTVGLKLDSPTCAVCLWVHDNGVGLPTCLDWRQSRSLGLRLVQILASQLRGTVETATGPGAEFRVTFSLKGIQS